MLNYLVNNCNRISRERNLGMVYDQTELNLQLKVSVGHFIRSKILTLSMFCWNKALLLFHRLKIFIGWFRILPSSFKIFAGSNFKKVVFQYIFLILCFIITIKFDFDLYSYVGNDMTTQIHFGVFPILGSIYKKSLPVCRPFLCGNVNKRFMITSLRAGTTSMNLAKETFVKFCSHFERIPYESLHSDPLVVHFIINTVKDQDFYINRAFQLALEVSYSRRHFSRSSILSHFEKILSIHNPLDRSDNTSPVTQCELFNALQARIIKQIYPAWNIRLNQTPSTAFKVSDLSPQEQHIFIENKHLTQNSIPDYSINGMPYDAKCSAKTYMLKNQIYILVESEKAFKLFNKHLFELSRYINRTNSLTPSFQKLIKDKLKIIENEWCLAKDYKTKREIINSWNNFIIQVGPQRPSGFGNCLFVITETPYVPDLSLSSSTAKVHVLEGHLDQVKTKGSLCSIIDTYPRNLQDSIFQATRGALGHLLPKNESESIID